MRSVETSARVLVEDAPVGKGQIGSALMGSLLIVCFLTDFLGTPVNLLVIFPKVPGRTFFHNLTKLITFAAAPLVLTPFVRNQDAPVDF